MSEIIWMDLEALSKAVESLANSGKSPGSSEHHLRWGIDIETDAWTAFRPVTCLIQIVFEAGGSIYLIDPLDDASWPQIHAFLKQVAPHVEWIMHDGTNDIRFLKHDLQLEIHSIYDTAIAARVLKHPKSGLAALVESACGVTLAKEGDQANWRARPLAPALLTYAAEDVRYLHQIATSTHQSLVENGLEHIFRDECTALVAEAQAFEHVNPDVIMARDGSEIKTLVHEPLEVQKCARALCRRRAQVAAEKNIHTSRVLHNAQLIKAAQTFVMHRTISPRLRKKLEGDRALEDILTDSLNVDWSGLSPDIPTRSEKNMLAELKRLRTELSSLEQFKNYPWILSTRQLKQLVRLDDFSDAALIQNANLRPWQVAAFAERLRAWRSKY